MASLDPAVRETLPAIEGHAEERIMRVILIGASGRIGTEVDKLLSADHEIVRVGASSGGVQCEKAGVVP